MEPALVQILVVVVGVGLGVPSLVVVMRRLSTRGRLAAAFLLYAVVAAAAYFGSPSPGRTSVLEALAALLAVNLAFQFLETVLVGAVLERRFHIGVSRLILDLVHFAVLAVTAVAVSTEVAGGQLELTDVLVTSTVLSAVLGLALQGVLGNVFAGLAIHAEAPFRTGDWVRLRDHEGQIVDIGWRTLTIRTRQNNHILIPNDGVAQSDLINYMRPTVLQAVDQYVSLSYDDPPHRVKQVLAAAASDVDDVRRQPPPLIYVVAYEDFGVRYRIRFWITDPGRLPEISDAVMSRVWYQVRRAGMTIPFPIRDVRLRRQIRPAASEALARTKEALAAHPVLGALDDEALQKVAAMTSVVTYAPGERVVREGDEGNSMYLIRDGRLRVEMTAEGSDRPVTLSTREAGDFFGEMSLLTGEPRSATVIAETQAELLRVDKAAVAEVLLAQPAAAALLSQALTDRAAESKTLRESYAKDRAGHSSGEDLAAVLLQKIVAFFGVE